MNDLQRTLAYHERTKHRFERYAAALGYLDWATQPDPFRRYAGAELLALDLVEPVPDPSWDAIFREGTRLPRPLDRAFVSQLLFDSLALSAWKQHQGARWSLRVNPSSGNLHPTEGYLLLPAVPGLSSTPTVTHYAPSEHGLEVRAELDPELWQSLTTGLPSTCVLVGLTSILWREAWKYGERAFRYCQHDIGHAIAAIGYAAAICGWSARVLTGPVDSAIAELLGVAGHTGPEKEHVECLLALTPGTLDTSKAQTWVPSPTVLARVQALPWKGTPNALSREHHDWPVIEEVAEATRKRSPTASIVVAPSELRDSFFLALERQLPARRLVRQRRSAVAMDGETRITRLAFTSMLERLAQPALVPFAALPWPPALDLVFFVHRVEDLESGLYLLVREPRREELWRESLRSELVPTRITVALGTANLFRLVAADVTREAAVVSCHQEIASDGAFAVAMLAEFEPSLRAHGASFYRRLHWEAGAIGHSLYLEAEAWGVRATGIGCFFDDAVHELLGIRDRRLQSLYHFTVGGAVDDPRLRTLEPYAHRAP